VAEHALHRLRQGLPVEDVEFDRLYPDWARRLSPIHWTPVAVARRAGELLAPAGERILDVGSGVGKLCLVAALTSRGVFYGVEQHLRCVEASRIAAARANVGNVHFIHGNMTDVDWSAFDGFYLYNPFVELLWGGSSSWRPAPNASPAIYNAYVAFVVTRLHEVRVGCRLVTYYGFGGNVPPTFELVASEKHDTDVLELWVKTGRRR
jgi:hypothetical protein